MRGRRGLFFRQVPFWVDLLTLDLLLLYAAYLVADDVVVRHRELADSFYRNFGTMSGRVNAIESVFWVATAWISYFVLRKRFDTSERLAGWIAVVLTIFGASDVVEIGTGAWWRPWWLLSLKVLCVLVLIVLISLYYRLHRQTASEKETSTST